MNSMETSKVTPKQRFVYMLDFGMGQIAFTYKHDMISAIETELESIELGDSQTFKVSMSTMTQEEYDNLPEWES